jgi:hypothetical protein
MRRPLFVLTAGLIALSAACGTDRTGGGVPAVQPAPGQAAASQPGTGTAPSADPRAVLCPAVGEVYSAKLGPFAAALSRMTTVPAGSGEARAARDEAGKALGSFAAEIRSVTATAAVDEARRAGAQVADTMTAKSTDDKFFGGIRTAKDVEKVLGTTVTGWLAPIDRYCS